MTHKNIKGRTFFRAHASQGPTKTGYYPDIFATVLENPHVLHRSAILFTRSCLHRKRYLTFFSLQQRNQVKLHLPDRKESLMKTLRRFRDPRNVFFLPNGLKNLHGWLYVSTENHFLNSNREKTLTAVCEMLAKPGAYEDILLSFVILAHVLLTIQLLLCLVKGDFQHKTEFMELNKK